LKISCVDPGKQSAYPGYELLGSGSRGLSPTVGASGISVYGFRSSSEAIRDYPRLSAIICGKKEVLALLEVE